jgi:hypothetical protein
MPLDTVLTLLNVVWGLVLTGIGIEMVNNPPGELRWKRWAYRILFIVFGALVIVTTAVQSARNEGEQSRLRRDAETTERTLSNRVSEEGGKLDAIAHFEQQFLTFVSQQKSGTSDKAYEAMATAVMRLAQGSSSATASSPPGGRLEILYDGSNLNGQALTVPVVANGQFQLQAFHTKNIGARSTGQVSARIYFNKPISSASMWMATDSEENGFPVSFWIGGMMGPTVINPTETWNWFPFVAIYPNWPNGEAISAKIKFFYGTDKPTEASFTIRKQ